MPNPQNIINHKFKPGKSGNPAGRKPGRNMATILRDLLEIKLETYDSLTRKREKKKVSEIIALSLVRKAQQGDVRAIEMIFDRIDGKAVQPIDHSGEIDQKTTDLSKLSFKELYALKWGK